MSFYHDLDSCYSLDSRYSESIYNGRRALFPHMDPAPFALYPNKSVRTKEECAAEFDRIYAIVQAATSVRTKVVSVPKNAAPTKAVPISSTSVCTEVVSVPKNAAPTKAVPISSVGPIPVPKTATNSLVQISSVGPVPVPKGSH